MEILLMFYQLPFWVFARATYPAIEEPVLARCPPWSKSVRAIASSPRCPHPYKGEDKANPKAELESLGVEQYSSRAQIRGDEQWMQGCKGAALALFLDGKSSSPGQCKAMVEGLMRHISPRSVLCQQGVAQFEKWH
jgi:hypothetical protein